ncbi:MAG: SpoIIE family protein phosphatase [Acidobacteria bacterium]|nr:SpoIIE family protein phosphatase [Acidobacteriota bacterium]
MSWKYKILVVDDEPDLERLMLQRMRRDIRAGLYKFVFAHNGVEALDLLKEQPDIDLVLSDINMPKMDGLTLIGQIPKVQPDIRSVIISAYGDMKNIRTAMNRGAFDFVTKPIDFDDLKLTISRTLQHLVEWRDALKSRDKLAALQNELGVASKIQQSILPTRFPDRPGCRIFANMKPARNVGGDFFDVIHLADGRIGIAIADVSDKGVPAALFMMSCRTLIKGAAIGKTDPGEVLHEVNQLLQEDNDAAMFVTVFYGVYDPDSQRFHYANGGHNSPLVVHADGSSAELPLTGGIALGLIPDLDYENKTVTLSPGDLIVLYTDGVTEAFDEQENQFGTQRLQEVFAGTKPTDVQAANRSVFEAVEKFAGDTPQSDDITCVTLLHGSDGG